MDNWDEDLRIRMLTTDTKLKLIRQEKKLTVRQLAIAAGIQYSRLHDIEQRRRVASKKVIEDIARVLEVRPEEISGDLLTRNWRKKLPCQL